MSKRSEHAIKREDLDALTIKDYHDIVKEYHSESDRAAAVLVGSYIELYTAKFLWHFMRSKLSNNEFHNLFNNYGPLSSFSARIEVAYAFGFIDEKLRKDLKTIKDIRNLFSHKHKLKSFSEEPILGYCRNLIGAKQLYGRSGNEFQAKYPKELYLVSISILLVKMHNKMMKKKPKKI